jgi:hypothetical protein
MLSQDRFVKLANAGTHQVRIGWDGKLAVATQLVPKCHMLKCHASALPGRITMGEDGGMANPEAAARWIIE